MIYHWHAPPSRSLLSRHLLNACVAASLLFSGCDRLPFDQSKKALEQGQQKQAAQDFPGAVAAYEKALDGSARTADVHFRLGIIYDQNLNNRLSAVHHFQRYVELSPNGLHAKEAKANIARLERNLATNLNDGTLIGHAEALRLKQENQDLKTQLAAAKASIVASANVSAAGAANPQAGKAADREAQRKLAPGTRTYQVQPGDTLASISRKFYRSKNRAKDIQDANQNAIADARKLKQGQILIIP